MLDPVSGQEKWERIEVEVVAAKHFYREYWPMDKEPNVLLNISKSFSMIEYGGIRSR
jgi:hypothetical protein